MSVTIPPELATSVDGAVLLIRADANSTMGTGHAMRCLAIAEAWNELGGAVVLASVELPEAIADRYTRAGARVVRIRSSDEAVRMAVDAGARHAVLDGYHLGKSDQRALKDAGMRLLVVDDRGETATEAADLVLNQNATASRNLYGHLQAALLLGIPYVLLRREFRVASPQKPQSDELRVLVSFGGADPANLTSVAIEAIAALDVHAVVIAGPANPRAGELRAPPNTRALIDVVPSVDDMAARMRWADLAIVAAGSTCWELAALGVPMIAIPIADNQLAVSDSLGSLGIGVPIARDATDASTLRATVEALARDVSGRAGMARKGRELIDGHGALRVCAALRDDGAGR